MVHKDGRFIWIQKSHFTVLITLPTFKRSWFNGKRVLMPSIRLYTVL